VLVTIERILRRVELDLHLIIVCTIKILVNTGWMR